jgi:5-methyltetrahydrofolate corrinoid/iron sulfur protein methyltransferase
MIIVGERLNSSRESVRRALENRDAAFVLDQARRQAEAGAAYIDLNAAALMDQEVEALRWAIPVLQNELSVPLALDTPNPAAMAEALRIHRGKPLLNSLTAEPERLDALLPLVREHKPCVIALLLDDKGPPPDADGALAVAEKLLVRLTREGLADDEIFLDPLVRPVGVESRFATVFLDSLEKIKTCLPGVKTIAGLSNVSFGLPQRKLLNRTLLVLALERGLDAAICDPLDADLRAALRAAEALLGRDPSLRNYLKFIREKSD